MVIKEDTNTFSSSSTEANTMYSTSHHLVFIVLKSSPINYGLSGKWEFSYCTL